MNPRAAGQLRKKTPSIGSLFAFEQKSMVFIFLLFCKNNFVLALLLSHKNNKILLYNIIILFFFLLFCKKNFVVVLTYCKSIIVADLL